MASGSNRWVPGPGLSAKFGTSDEETMRDFVIGLRRSLRCHQPNGTQIYPTYLFGNSGKASRHKRMACQMLVQHFGVLLVHTG
jgi:hypothetical protein